MNRRTLLGGLGGLLATAGCIGQLTPGSAAIESKELTAYDPDDTFYDEAPGVRDPPKIAFVEAETQVRVTGKLFVGSSACNKAVLKEASYNRNTDTLRLTVGSGEKETSGNFCTGDESSDAYRAITTFRNQLPQTVVATEEDGGTKTTAHPNGQ
ncbi:hypothetical protein C5B91_19465 [Haloferax sp. Atlit-10N]|uniref:hypothetical protein n=1 Tax=unclassified Haloferax TaxID=2625095 RepID=UPI000E257B1E|nr:MULTISPECIES: hypothetical protein [unclassified Haloferax]RDZ39554.1 hypothetical protein C5B87_18850 [Haloferax sp. Atlit-16N]RDZ55998.1 hypothetical protein C5B91_19465 [Haloferax sp. Atlit-10N]